MTRIAVYECRCCGRSVSLPMAAGHRAVARIRCEGWCLRCDGACRDVARRTAIEREEDAAPLEPEPALVAPTVRLVRPSARLDLRDFRPQDQAW